MILDKKETERFIKNIFRLQSLIEISLFSLFYKIGTSVFFYVSR